MHSGRMNQCYIKITRNTFITKTSRSYNGPAVRIKGNKQNGIVQFVLKIAHLAISMEPTPLLEKVSSHGLLPRLWLPAKQFFFANVHIFHQAFS